MTEQKARYVPAKSKPEDIVTWAHQQIDVLVKLGMIRAGMKGQLVLNFAGDASESFLNNWRLPQE